MDEVHIVVGCDEYPSREAVDAAVRAAADTIAEHPNGAQVEESWELKP